MIPRHYMSPQGIATVNRIGKAQTARLRLMRERRNATQATAQTVALIEKMLRNGR